MRYTASCPEKAFKNKMLSDAIIPGSVTAMHSVHDDHAQLPFAIHHDQDHIAFQNSGHTEEVKE